MVKFSLRSWNTGEAEYDLRDTDNGWRLAIGIWMSHIEQVIFKF